MFYIWRAASRLNVPTCWPNLAKAFRATGVCRTLVIIRGQVMLYAQPGALPEQALEQLISQAREIDMDEPR